MTTPTAEGLVPSLFGYSRCGHCGTWRPASGLVFVGDFPPACVDRFWCERQAKRPTGIDSNGDAT
jgi:hypothetical protein